MQDNMTEQKDDITKRPEWRKTKLFRELSSAGKKGAAKLRPEDRSKGGKGAWEARKKAALAETEAQSEAGEQEAKQE